MRPRISQLEAQFILETLLTRKEYMQGLDARRQELEHEVWRLKQQFQYDHYGALKEGLTDKKQELQSLEAQRFRLWLSVAAYESLIAKYQVLADGSKHKGRYKTAATQFKYFIKT